MPQDLISSTTTSQRNQCGTRSVASTISYCLGGFSREHSFSSDIGQVHQLGDKVIGGFPAGFVERLEPRIRDGLVAIALPISDRRLVVGGKQAAQFGLSEARIALAHGAPLFALAHDIRSRALDSRALGKASARSM